MSFSISVIFLSYSVFMSSTSSPCIYLALFLTASRIFSFSSIECKCTRSSCSVGVSSAAPLSLTAFYSSSSAAVNILSSWLERLFMNFSLKRSLEINCSKSALFFTSGLGSAAALLDGRPVEGNDYPPSSNFLICLLSLWFSSRCFLSSSSSLCYCTWIYPIFLLWA